MQYYQYLTTTVWLSNPSLSCLFHLHFTFICVVSNQFKASGFKLLDLQYNLILSSLSCSTSIHCCTVKQTIIIIIIIIISRESWLALFPEKPLTKASVSLRTYTAQPIALVGQVDVRVHYRSFEGTLRLYVVEGSGPTLLGRDWLTKIQLDWSSIKAVSASAPTLSQLVPGGIRAWPWHHDAVDRPP